MDMRISDHFTPLRLIRFTLPAMGMLLLTSLYTIVDGYFVSNYVGKTAFVAVNLIFPFIMIPATLGTMIGTGGSALVAKTLGRGKKALANSRFSLLVYGALLLGVGLSLLWLPFLEPAARLLGAEGDVLEACNTYGRVLIPGLTPMIAQYMFQSFFPLAGKPQLGLWVTLAAGLTNAALDFVLIIVCGWGLLGAALATVAGMLVGSVLPLVFFWRARSGDLRLGRARFEGGALIKSCTNGASEFMSTVSVSLVSMLYNFLLLRLAGENGVAAFGVIMYVGFLCIAIFCGYGFGSIPIIGYHFGARHAAEVKSLLAYSLIINLFLGVLFTIGGMVLARPLALLFVGYDPQLMDMAVHAYRLYLFSFLFMGFNIFASSFFTALNNGLISAGISFIRTLVFQVLTVLMLPRFLGLDGIWLATVAAEFLTLFFTFFWIAAMRKRYGYM